MKNSLLFSTVVFILLSSLRAEAQIYPSNFSQVEVASGIANPTVMAFAPDGRIFVAQQDGVIHVIKNGVKLATPALQLTVNSSGERGLIGMTLHPSFSTNGVIYLYYTVPDGSRNRISRFWFNGDVINPTTEQLILNLDPLSSATNHNGGAMHFKGDKLYIAVGENANGANAQNLLTYHGKLLRINANGSIPGDNPFYSINTTPQTRSIWALGLRNPYTFNIQPGTERILVNDVGQNTWEEIDDATPKGLNFGWPSTEGNTSNVNFTSPVFAYGHGSGDGAGCAITGGVFFNPTATSYPSQFQGKYFYQDLCNAWINYLDLTTGVRNAFATGLPGQSLALDIGTDGNLYFLSRTSPGKLYKIIYTNTQSPVITDQPDNTTISAGQTASFSVTASGATPMSFQWKKNNTNIPGATAAIYTVANAQPSDAGNFTVTVSNSFGSVNSHVATLTVSGSNALPIPVINTPTAGTMYRAGDVINFSGDATDTEDGTLPASAFQWHVIFHHDAHVHDGPPVASGVKSGSFTIPTSGETSINVFYSVQLDVTDSNGATAETHVDLRPNTSIMSLQTNPAGLNLTIDGQPVATLASIRSVENLQRTIGVVTPQTVNTVTYDFASWAHGGTAPQTVATPIDNTTYTANFSKALTVPWRTTDIGKQNIFGDASISGGTFTLSASGRDIYNNDDHFRFVYQSITGDCDLRAVVTGITNTNAWAKAGIMLRETLQPNAANAMTLVTPSSGTSFQRRLNAGGPTTANNASGLPPYWVRLVRSGNTFTSYVSTNGTAWTMVGTPVTISMASTVYAGLAVTSHNSNALCTATMTNVSVSPGTGATEMPQQIVVLTEDTDEDLQLYPNPATGDVVTVHSRRNLADCRIQVLNALGQVMLNKVTDGLSADDDIDIRNIPPGFYFVRVDSKWHKMAATFLRK